MNPYFILTFGTDKNREHTIRVSNARTNLSAANVKSSMNSIVTQNPFLTDKGVINKILNATLVKYTLKQMNLT